MSEGISRRAGVSAVGSAGGSRMEVHCLFLDFCSYWCVWYAPGLSAKVTEWHLLWGADPQALQCGLGFSDEGSGQWRLRRECGWMERSPALGMWLEAGLKPWFCYLLCDLGLVTSLLWA